MRTRRSTNTPAYGRAHTNSAARLHQWPGAPLAHRLLRCAPRLLLACLACLACSAQINLDHEPPGPSSRRTGLVITEIMYHPRPIPGLATNVTAEFIELYNSKPWDEDLSGYFLDGAIHYVFSTGTVLRAGDYLVVARVPGLIRTHYGVTNVVGPWDGANTNGLSPDAGSVRLRHRLGAVLVQVDYRDSPPWPEAADGTGHSLALHRPSRGENQPAAWAQSDSVGGSPGQPEPFTPDPLASVRLNEWQHHSDPEDFIELYNHANAPVDLSGAWLSDDPTTNKFRIADGTVIPARGHLLFYQSQLGFELFAGGETILLWNSNQTRVIDVIDFRGASNNVSMGRWPDGAPNIYRMATNSPGTRNIGPRRDGVVINEIMYNPISGSSDDEYVEIYNRGNTAVNLAGWEFIVGISYIFPTNAFTSSMPPGAHWVVARNPSNLFTIYPNLNVNNTFGPFSGTLANGGERIALAAADYDTVTRGGVTTTERLNVIVSDVTYADGGKWGMWSDGLGSSLELIDPEANEQMSSSWADSNDTGESQWTAIEFTGPVGETLGTIVNDRLIIMLQGVGECLVDEVEVRVNNGPNLVANGGFENGLDGWTLQGSHDFSAVENSSFAGAKSLHVRAGSRGDNQSNRILSAPLRSVVPSDATAVSLRAKVRWLRGHPELLLRLHGSATEAYGRMSLPRKLGTPGQINSTRVANAGPAVSDVKHAPVLPQAGQQVVVTARAVDRHGVAAVTLNYRLDPDPTYTSVPMVDDGTSGDDVANDGVYAAIIPGQANGQLVAFYVEGRDGLNAVGTFPQDVFPKGGLDRCWPTDALVRECLVRWGEVQMPGDFATYHLWVSAVNSNRWHHRNPLNNTPMDGTFVYNDTRVIYNALPLFSGSPFHRTNSSAGPAGPFRVDYVLNLPEDDELLGTTDFVLNNPGNPDRYVISDQSAVSESTVMRIFEGLGLPNNHRRYIHLFVNGSQRSTAYERSGNFIFEDSQQPNGDVIAQWFPDDAGGQLFKVEDWFEFDANGFDPTDYNDADLARRTVLLHGQPAFIPASYRFMFRKRSVNVGSSANDYSPIFQLIDRASPSDNPTNAFIDPQLFGTIADWEMWMRHFAVQRAIGNFDSYGWDRGKNDYLYRTSTGFVHLPWDLDYSLGLGRPATEPLFGSSDPRITAMQNTPEIARAYWRAFQDLVNGPFSNSTLDPFIDARVHALTNNNIDIDLTAVANIKSYVSERRAFIQSQLDTVTVPFGIAGPASFDTTNNLLIINGTAPIAVKAITLNGVSYPMTWSSVTSFVMRVVLHAGANTLILRGYDRFGNLVPNSSLFITPNFTGSEPDPIGSLVISEIFYAAPTNGSQFIEILNRSANSFDLTGWRLDGSDASFPLGSIVTNGQRVVLARNYTAFKAAYPSVPVFGTFNATLTTNQIVALVRTNGSLGDVVSAVNYSAGAPWPAAPSGQSLQVTDSFQDNRRVSNWRVDQPTPGSANASATPLPAFDGVWLNEVQVTSMQGTVDNFAEPSPWVELVNVGTNSVSLDDYFLATDVSTDFWRFPGATTMEPGEHKVIWADGEFWQSTATELHTSFAIGSTGELALWRLTNGQPQLLDHISWRKLGLNACYGSFPEGQPTFRSLLSHATPGETNAGRPLPICINEFLASNVNGLRDPADSDPDDWFELYNVGSQTIDLGGCWLSDDPLVPQKYRVPTNGQYRLAPGAFLLVWADSETNQNRADRIDLHAGFKLTSAPGFIGLYAPDGTNVIDAISYGTQTNSDVSMGRYTDGSESVLLTARPTPRSYNNAPGINTAPRYGVLTNVIAVPGQLVALSVRPADADGNPLTYSLVEGSTLPGVSLLASGVFRWSVPTNQAVGDYPVTITATDNGSPPLSDTVSFLVYVRSPSAPMVSIAPGPHLSAVSSVSGEATFTISTVPGRTYRVLYRDDLAAGAWAAWGSDFVAAGAEASVTDRFEGPKRFYRVLEF